MPKIISYLHFAPICGILPLSRNQPRNMFVRKKPMPTKPRPLRHAVQIVHSQRHGKKVNQKVVQHCGFADLGEELDRLVSLAEAMRLELEVAVLFSPEESQRQLQQAKQDLKKGGSRRLNVDLSQLVERQRICTGIHEVYGALYEELGLDRLLPPTRYRASNDLLRQIVMARLAKPLSKRASVGMLANDMGVELSLPAVYRMMDHLDDKRIEKLNSLALERAKTILPEPFTLWLFDCTTLYFESFVADELKKPGYSKDAKFKESQVVMALAVTPEGLPVGYEIFPGNQYEGATLVSMVKRLCDDHQVKKATVVADRGMMSKKNLEALRKEEINYVVGARLKNQKEDLKAQVTDMSHYTAVDKDGELTLACFDREDDSLVVTRSEKRAKKDRHDREEAIARVKKKLEESDNPKQWLSNRGHARYLKLSEDENTTVELNEDSIADQARWDGLHGIVTNMDLTETDPTTALGFYHDLWVVEQTFRVTKHDLMARPMFHWTPRRVKAHLAIAFMALMCIRHLEYRVGIGVGKEERMSARAIQDALTRVEQSVLEHTGDNRRYAIPSQLNKEARKLYRIMGRKHPQKPYEILDLPA